MEANTTQRRLALEDKIPDIEQTLNMVQLLKQQQEQEQEQSSPDPLQTTFELNDTLFAHATLEPIKTVNLWLGVRLSSPSPLFLVSCSILSLASNVVLPCLPTSLFGCTRLTLPSRIN